MKKLSFTLLIFCCSLGISFGQLFTGENHFQTYSGPWKHFGDGNFRVAGSHQNERVLFEFNIKSKSYKILSDSLEKNTTRFYFDSDTGYAVDNNFKAYITYDSFKTMTLVPQGANVADLYKTSTGYLGYQKSISTTNLVYSTDLLSWTTVGTVGTPGSTSFNLVFIGNRIYAINQCSQYLLSTDGGASFNTITTSNTNDYFAELISMPDTSNILAKSSSQYLISNDGGKNWTKTNLIGGYSIFYADNLDSIYFTNQSVLTKDSLYLSTDTFKTIRAISGNLDSRVLSKRVKKYGDYFVAPNSTELIYSNKLHGAWQVISLYLNGRFSIDMKGKYVLSGGEGGKYCLSNDGGKTYQNFTIINAKDLLACRIIHDSLFLFSDRESDIYRSTDGGITWDKTYNAASIYLGRKFDYNSDFSRIILWRNSSGALISNDYGQSWKVLSGQLAILGSITPNNKIYAAQQQYTAAGIKQSVEELKEDGTRTIIKQFTEDGLGQLGLAMFDNTRGYYFAAASGSKELQVFITDDAWANYSLKGTIPNFLPTLFYGYQLDYFLPGKDTLYIHLKNTSGGSFNSKEIYYSFDGGASWNSEELVSNRFNSPDKIGAIHFLNSKEFVSIWTAGRIFKNTNFGSTGGNGGPTTSVQIRPENQHIVYPNPFNNMLHIKMETNSGKAYLYSLSGKLIMTEELINSSSALQLPELEKGIYFLRIQTSKGLETHKLIKE